MAMLNMAYYSSNFNYTTLSSSDYYKIQQQKHMRIIQQKQTATQGGKGKN
jgi:hypothetical protein